MAMLKRHFMKKVWVLITILLTTTLLNTSVYATSTIADQWKNSPAFGEYLKAKNAWNIKRSIEIRKTTIKEISKTKLGPLVDDFKDKYEQLMLSKFYKFPTWLNDLAIEIHEKWKSLLKNKSEKWRHNFVKGIYNFLDHYNSEDWNAEKFAHRLVKKSPWIEWTQFVKTLISMWKQADIEAGKTPQQRQKEHEEYMLQTQKDIDASQKNIDASQKNIDNWNEIINKLKSL